MSVLNKVYYYRNTSGSLSNSPRLTDISDVKFIVNNILDYISNKKLEKKKRNIIYNELSKLIRSTLIRNKIIDHNMIDLFMKNKDCPFFFKARILFIIFKIKFNQKDRALKYPTVIFLNILLARYTNTYMRVLPNVSGSFIGRMPPDPSGE